MLEKFILGLSFKCLLFFISITAVGFTYVEAV